MTKKDTILITGATGNIGTALVHVLASHVSQPTIRAATRSVNSPAASLLHALNPNTVTPVAFDLDQPGVLAAALEGVTKLCVIAPFGNAMGAWHTRLMEAVSAAGSCDYIVKVSVTGARSPDSDPPPGGIPLAHWQGEEAIRRSGIPATMIRPTIFMQHFLSVPGLYQSGDNRFYLPTGAAKIAFVDCRDIGIAAARLLVATAEERRPFDDTAFELTGPSAVSGSEIAAILGWVTEQPFHHVDGEAQFVARCQELGQPDFVKAVYAEAAEGWFSAIENEAFIRLTGHRPTAFAKFAYDHASYFQAR